MDQRTLPVSERDGEGARDPGIRRSLPRHERDHPPGSFDFIWAKIKRRVTTGVLHQSILKCILPSIIYHTDVPEI